MSKKKLIPFIVSIVFPSLVFAVDRKQAAGDTIVTKYPIRIETSARYPGGMQEFSKYISNQLKYPEVARLVGINGKVKVQFVVETDGEVTNVRPVNCIGAGCESEAVSVIERSPIWVPGMQNNKPVRSQYTIPINFTIPAHKVNMKDLRKSKYGFVFYIDGTFYSLDNAEPLIGKSFNSEIIEVAEQYDNPQYLVPGKLQTFLIKIRPGNEKTLDH